MPRIKVIEQTADEFHGRYKKHDISISRESDYIYYIMVACPDGTYAYDGWWGDDLERHTMEQAVQEALEGSLLTAQPQGGEAKP